MIGPEYSVDLSDRSALIIKAKAGSFYVEHTISSFSVNTFHETSSLGYCLGLQYRYRFAQHWSGTLESDLFSGRSPSFSNDKNINGASINIGVVFLLLHKEN